VKNSNKFNICIVLIALILIIPIIPIGSVSSEQTSNLSTGINFEGPYDWHYTISDENIDQDFQLLKENNVDQMEINLIWSAFQTSINPPQYNEQNINNVKRVLDKAEQYQIGVLVNFFQYWMDTTTGVPSWCIDPWTGNQRTIAIVRDETIKGYFLDMVAYLVDQFKYSQSITSWSILNEPMHSGSYTSEQITAEREEFHQLIEEGATIIRNLDNRPITVKFTLPYSPWHTRTAAEYETFVDFSRVMQSLDFVSINTFADPKDFGSSATWEGTTWFDFSQAVQDTKNAGYQFWVTEFGDNSRKDEIQRSYYEDAIGIFKELGVDRCFGWVWVHDSRDEKYNLCKKNGNPRPAFFELNLDPQTPPSESEMTTEDWTSFWEWLKINPPGWLKSDWSQTLETTLQEWKAQTGINDMNTENWIMFWEWLKQNPLSIVKTPRKWSPALEELFSTWKSENL
jgi:hypothetical protein